jgi:putative transferase (TIGR04331 family)
MKSKKTITKLYFDHENSIEDRLNDKCSGVRYAQMGTDCYKLLRNSKLVVATNNCTTPVESIAINTLTIPFWYPEHWELAVSPSPFFDKLHDCAVFHDSPESAVLTVNQVRDDVDKWRQSDDVVPAYNELN